MNQRGWQLPAFAGMLLGGLLHTGALAAGVELERAGREELSAQDWQALLASVANQPALAAKAHRMRCLYLSERVDDASRARVAESVKLGLPLAEQSQAGAEQAGLTLCRGYLSEVAGRLKDAAADYERGVQLATAAKAEDLRAEALIFRGDLRYQRGDAQLAMVDLLEAYRSAEQRGDRDQWANALNSLANLYASRQVGQPEKAVEIYRQLLKVHEARKKPADIATAYFNLGATLRALKRSPESREMLQKALAQFQALGDVGSVAETQREIAQLLLTDKRPEDALPLADAATRTAERMGDASVTAYALLTRGTVLRQLGRLPAAASDLERAQAHFQAEDNVRAQELTLAQQAEVFAAQGRFDAAYRTLSRQREVNERLTRQQNEELSARLRIGFDTERKEQENAALQREAAAAIEIRRLQRTLMVLGGLLFAGLAALAWRLARQARRMRRLALTDELTGLPNRRAILGKLQARLQAGEAVTTLMLDIDHFKRINDHHGHDVGDEVLRVVATTARAALQPDAPLGRIGGEEFLVLLAQGDLTDVAERLRTAVESLQFEGPARGLSVTISLGGTTSLPEEKSPEQVLKRADLALYDAKGAGRNCFKAR